MFLFSSHLFIDGSSLPDISALSLRLIYSPDEKRLFIKV
jgi:hypothetical protein